MDEEKEKKVSNLEKEKKIPNLEIDAKNRIIEQILEVPLMVNGKEIKVKIRKLNTGTRNKIRGECIKITIVGGQPQVKVDESEIQEKILAKAIIEAPFEISVESIKQLPSDVVDYLFEEYNQFAEPSEKKNS